MRLWFVSFVLHVYRDIITKYSVSSSHFILRKSIKFVATRCQILRLKCTKFNFGWVSAPDPDGGAYIAPQTLSWI